MLKSVIAAGISAACLSIAPAGAATLYDNDASTYSENYLNVSQGGFFGPQYAASSFHLSTAAQITSITFVTWKFSGTQAVTGLDWDITATPFGSALAGQTGASFTSSVISTPSDAITILNNTITPLAPVILAAGNYWFDLKNPTPVVLSCFGVCSQQNPINWDTSVNNPSSGYTYSGFGGYHASAQSYSFEIIGESVSTTPLPSTWLMLLSGFVGLGYFAYRGTKKRAALAVA